MTTMPRAIQIPSRETVENLGQITTGMLANHLEASGWTLQETVLDLIDVWTIWREDELQGDEVLEILAPAPLEPALERNGKNLKPGWPATARAIGELAFFEGLSPEEVIQQILQRETSQQEEKH